MARAAYGLSEYATSTIESMNGTTYTLTIWTTIATGSPASWTLGEQGAQISYETESQDDKNSPILTSKLTIPIMVENDTMKIALTNFRSSLAEKSIWATIRRGTSGSYIWCGYVIQDLDQQEDLSYPYVNTLTAIDGISTLKEVPFLRETNSDTGSVPTFPYVRSDTWDNAGYKEIIGTTSSWIVRLLDNVGQLLAADDTGGELENYTIQTSFNWWNEEMGTPAAGTDPLALMKLSMRPFYTEAENGTYTVPNVYEVLKAFCINFNMRVLYWNHRFNFIQIGEYKADEEGASPYTTPINIPTREYYYNGGAKSDLNYIGDKNYGIYKLAYENSSNPGAGLQKLAGSQYQALPAIKRTKCTFNEASGPNLFNGFPLFVTHNLVSGLPTAWDTTGNVIRYTIRPQSGDPGSGIYQSMLVTDAKDLSGFVARIFCNFENTTTSDLVMESVWSMRAKPVDSAWGDGDNKTLKRIAYSNYSQLEWGAYQFPLTNNSQYIYDQITIPTTGGGIASTRVEVFNSSTNPTTNTASYGGDNNGAIPIHADMAGEWEFQFFTFTEFDSNATYPMRASTSTVNYSHGRIVNIADGTALNYDGSATELEHVPTSYAVDYLDSLDQTLSPPFVSEFRGVMAGETELGVNGKRVEISQDSSDTYEYDFGVVRWGDGTGANTFSSIQVYDTANTQWEYSSITGKWARGLYSWNAGTSQFDYSTLTYNKTFIQILSENVLYQQSKSILTANATSALSETDKYFSGSTRLKFNNPLGKIIDTNGNEYIFMNGEYSIVKDEWTSTYVQQSYATPTIVMGSSDIYVMENVPISAGNNQGGGAGGPGSGGPGGF